MSCFAIILARGGSIGIPRKNLMRVGGVPLISRAIATARSTSSIDEVWVSSDDEEILKVSELAGAKVIRRPIEISGSTASSESALLHALEYWKSDGNMPEVLAFLQATSPFISSDVLDSAVQKVSSRQCDVAFSVVESHSFLWRNSNENLIGVNHSSHERLRRQDRDPEYLETGAFYVFDSEQFQKSKHRFFGRIQGILVSKVSAIEIDDPIDLELARAIAPLWKHAEALPVVKALVTDFDGVHTDDSVTVDQEGVESVTVSRRDGLGISRLKEFGIPILILSRETNPVVVARAKKLGVDCISGSKDKAMALRNWASENDILLDEIAYIGNDLNDLECLQLVGVPIAVADSPPQVLAQARIVAPGRPGIDAVRSVCELIIEQLAM